MHWTPSRVAFGGAIIISHLVTPANARAQSGATADSLVRRALTVNPRIRAAMAQLDAARARIGPAGTWVDPMLMAGIQNLPLARGSAMSAGPEPMTMTMLGVSQTIPYPGKTSLRTRAARAEADLADARLAAVARDVRREALDAWYDLVTARTLLGIIERQLQVASSVLPAAEARYVSGTAVQADILKLRTEAAMVAEARNAATAEERSALARLAAATNDSLPVGITSDSLVPLIPEAGPLPRLDSLTAQGMRTNPRLRERRAMLATQGAWADLAAREHLPDFDLSVQYGRRDRLPDMMTAIVSVPLPVRRSRKQGAAARAARFDVTAAEAELREEENAVRSDIARAWAAAQRQRANLELLDRAILPQAQAAFASVSAAYQSGRGELLNVLDAMRAQFATETMYVRALADYAKALNELRTFAGDEVIP